MTIQISNLYSESAGNRPATDKVAVGQLWLNLADSTIGTKRQDGTLIEFAQLSASEKQAALDGMPKSGQVSNVSVSLAESEVQGNVVINDSSNVVLGATLGSGTLTVTANKTSAHKTTKLTIRKAAGVTSSITWSGVDSWMLGSAPVFGDTSNEAELCVVIITSSTQVVANTLYNTEHPIEIEQIPLVWGNIDGTLSNQADLQTALNGKANASELAGLQSLYTTEVTQLKYLVDEAKFGNVALSDSINLGLLWMCVDDFENTSGIDTSVGAGLSISSYHNSTNHILVKTDSDTVVIQSTAQQCTKNNDSAWISVDYTGSGSVSAAISRDGGTTFTPCTNNALTSISSQPSGTQIVYKLTVTGAVTIKNVAWGCK